MLSSITDVTRIDSVEPHSAGMREKLIGKIFERLYSLSSVIDEHSREVEKLTGLSKNQAQTILAVAHSSSPRVSELARNLYLNPATMVRILDRLEEQGLVTRTRSKTDRRVVEIGLTEKAREAELVLQNFNHGNSKDCLEAADNRDLENMLETLQNLYTLLDCEYRHQSLQQDTESKRGIL